LNNMLRAIVVTGLAAGALAVAAVSTFATSTTQQTGNLALSIPVTMTFTGLAGQLSSASAAAGTNAVFTDLTGASASTNSATGMSITQQSIAGNAWNTSPPGANSIAASADTISVVTPCPTGATCAAAGPLANNGTPVVLISTAAAGSITFAVHNVLAVPAALPPGNYYNQIIFTATAV